MAASINSGFRFSVAGSMSTNTGFAPTMLMLSAVAKKVNGVVITSSPGPMPRARRAITSASVPLFTPMACLTPRYAATSCSNRWTSSPMMKSVRSSTRPMAAMISGRSSSISGFRSRMGICGVCGGGHGSLLTSVSLSFW